MLIAVAFLAVLVTGILVFTNYSSKSNKVLSFFKFNFGVSLGNIAQKSVDYLNSNKDTLLEGQDAALESFSEESGVVKMKIKIGTNTYNSYATKDGKLLFPNAFSLDGQINNK